MNNHIHHDGTFSSFILTLPFILALMGYVFASVISSRHHKPWPLYRTILFILGVTCAMAAVIGPLADRAHTDFTAHMLGHLLLGMLAPLLMVLARPMTLILRTLHVQTARHISSILRSRPMSILNHPIVTSLLNIGGLWILYTTDLYVLMHQYILLHILIHIHVFLAGYLFTASLIYVDPTPHRYSFTYRLIVFWMALAGHGILSKAIYAHPPTGVPTSQAETGGMLMYYGGDAIDLVMIFILCYQWYKGSWPRALKAMSS
jgi:putative membrane protein